MNNTVYHTEEDRIRDLLIGRRVVKVEGESCTLDDGTRLTIVPNEGCGGCSSGWYELDHLETVDNAITSVEFVEEGDSAPYSEKMVYKVFVFADAEKINMFSVSGDDGNGYYGTGYHIYVRTPGE